MFFAAKVTEIYCLVDDFCKKIAKKTGKLHVEGYEKECKASQQT